MIEMSEKVKNALFDKKPVVALESTILTHGFKKPHNFELALKAESIISSFGVTPATIAVIDGKIKMIPSKHMGCMYLALACLAHLASHRPR